MKRQNRWLAVTLAMTITFSPMLTSAALAAQPLGNAPASAPSHEQARGWNVPQLVADGLDNLPSLPIEITFEDNAKWRNAITSVLLNGELLETSQYSIEAAKLHLDRALFTTAKNNAVTINARGYKPATVIQSISHAIFYEATVASVVDGDTVHLTTPVLGTTTVRFLNIDTPETYHKVDPASPDYLLDLNQKEQGEVAKTNLKNNLHAGDEVLLKVGDSPIDGYGRLLAQVIRKSDGVNVNLEQVRGGYASTYFIWPVDEENYPYFSDAVKSAKEQGLGIWNQANPLLELPFIFRAREQGKGLSRHVGDSSTHKYVLPEQWEQVPVQYRVFFNSLTDAFGAGYLAKDETQVAAPYVVDLDNTNTEVTGVAYPNATVTVKTDTATLGTATAAANGSFTVSIPAQPGGTELAVTTTTPSGYTSAAALVTVQTLKTIADVRTGGKDQKVTLQGTVTGTSAEGKDFYVQDGTGAIFVFGGSQAVKVGDVVKLAGTTADFNGELEVKSLTRFVNQGTATVTAQELTPNGVTLNNQGALISLKDVEISGLTKRSGAFEFKAVKGAESVNVYVSEDYFGQTYDAFAASFQNGDLIDVVGNNTNFRGSVQLKPRTGDGIKSAIETDGDAVTADRNRLSIGYGTGNSDTNVTQDVALPTSGRFGSAISWESDLPGVISNTGVVTRPEPGTGDATVTLTATVTKGDSTVTQAFTLLVKQQSAANAAPTVGNPVGAQNLHIGQSLPLQLDTVFTDADGDALTFEAVAQDTNVATVSLSGNSLAVTPVQPGTTTVTLSANDGNGHVTEHVFDVNVTYYTITEARALAATNGNPTNPVVTVRGYLTTKTALAGSYKVFVIADQDSITDFRNPSAILIPTTASYFKSRALLDALNGAPDKSYVEITGTRDLYSNYPSLEGISSVNVVVAIP